MLQGRRAQGVGDPAGTFRAAPHIARRAGLLVDRRSLPSGRAAHYRVEERLMMADAKDNSQSRPRLVIPPGAVAILPLRGTVLFPSTVLPLAVGRPASLRLIEEAVRQQVPVGFVCQRDSSIETPQPSDLFSV